MFNFFLFFSVVIIESATFTEGVQNPVLVSVALVDPEAGQLSPGPFTFASFTLDLDLIPSSASKRYNRAHDTLRSRVQCCMPFC